MSSLFIARTKANRWDSCLTRPIDSIGGKIPFSRGCLGQAYTLASFLPRLNEWVILLQSPGREIFIHWEHESSVGGLIVEEFFHFDSVSIFAWDERFHLRFDLFLGFSKRHAAVNEDDCFVWYGIDRRCLHVQVADSDLSMTQKRMISELRLKVANASNDRKQFIDRVITEM